MPAVRSRDDDPRYAQAMPHDHAAMLAASDAGDVHMAESDPSTMSYDELDATDESLNARDIAREGAHRTPPRG